MTKEKNKPNPMPNDAKLIANTTKFTYWTHPYFPKTKTLIVSIMWLYPGWTKPNSKTLIKKKRAPKALIKPYIFKCILNAVEDILDIIRLYYIKFLKLNYSTTNQERRINLPEFQVCFRGDYCHVPIGYVGLSKNKAIITICLRPIFCL